MFDSLFDQIKEFLIESIMTSLSDMFADVNAKVAEIAVDVGQTPEGFNSGVFSMIRDLSDTIIVPIAGIILTFVASYELISMIIDKNNMHDVDTWMIFRWVMKTFLAVMLVTNAFPIIMGIFELAQHVVSGAADLITDSAELGLHMDNIKETLEPMTTAELMALYLQVQLVSLTLTAMSIVIFVVIWGRIMEIYLMISIGPIPLSTMGNQQWAGMGQNYLRSLAAIAMQGFFILVCVAIYAVMVETIQSSSDIQQAILQCCGYTVLLCFMLLKTGSFSKSVFHAH